jgi:hypothetical protein
VAGYPIAWEETPSLDQVSDKCPYTLGEMEEYLRISHFRWSLEEKPTTFQVSGPLTRHGDAERRYWLFGAHDRLLHRQWFVVVGTGKSPFDPSKRMKRWMYAQTNDSDLSPEAFLLEQHDQQLRADAMPR